MNSGVITTVVGIVFLFLFVCIIFLVANYEFSKGKVIEACSASQCLFDFKNGGKNCALETYLQPGGICTNRFGCPSGYYAIQDNLSSITQNCSPLRECPCAILNRSGQYQSINFSNVSNFQIFAQNYYDPSNANSRVSGIPSSGNPDIIYQAPLLRIPTIKYEDPGNLQIFKNIENSFRCNVGVLTPVLTQAGINQIIEKNTYLDKLRIFSSLPQQCSYFNDSTGFTGFDSFDNSYDSAPFLDSRTYEFPRNGLPYYDYSNNTIKQEEMVYTGSTGYSSSVITDSTYAPIDFSVTNFKNRIQHQFYINDFPKILTSLTNPSLNLEVPSLINNNYSTDMQKLNPGITPSGANVDFILTSPSPTLTVNTKYGGLSYFTPPVQENEFYFTININFGTFCEILISYDKDEDQGFENYIITNHLDLTLEVKIPGGISFFKEKLSFMTKLYEETVQTDNFKKTYVFWRLIINS